MTNIIKTFAYTGTLLSALFSTNFGSYIALPYDVPGKPSSLNELTKLHVTNCSHDQELTLEVFVLKVVGLHCAKKNIPKTQIEETLTYLKSTIANLIAIANEFKSTMTPKEYETLLVIRDCLTEYSESKTIKPYEKEAVDACLRVFQAILSNCRKLYDNSSNFYDDNEQLRLTFLGVVMEEAKKTFPAHAKEFSSFIVNVIAICDSNPRSPNRKLISQKDADFLTRCCKDLSDPSNPDLVHGIKLINALIQEAAP